MYQVAQPDPALRDFIENYWWVAPLGEPVSLSVDVYVDARSDLLFNFGVPYLRQVLGKSPVMYRHSCFDAQRNHPIRIEQVGAVAMVGVRFWAGGAAPFLSGALQQWTNQTPDLVSVLGSAGLDLERSLQAVFPDGLALKALLDQFFLGRLAQTKRFQRFWALKSQIERSVGQEPVALLGQTAGLSLRNQARLFSLYLGLSPKTYAQILRFQSALKHLMKAPQINLAELASVCGYFDQSHFVRDFKRFSGGVPKGYKGYYPETAPHDFAPNLVQFLQDTSAD